MYNTKKKKKKTKKTRSTTAGADLRRGRLVASKAAASVSATPMSCAASSCWVKVCAPDVPGGTNDRKKEEIYIYIYIYIFNGARGERGFKEKRYFEGTDFCLCVCVTQGTDR